MFIQDVRRSLRLFVREPAFAAAAVLTLALGIGANTALFAVVEAVLLRPLPFADADELVILKHRDTGTGISKTFIALGDFVDLRERQETMEPLAGYGGFQSTLIGEPEPVRVEGLSVTPEFFETMHLTPAMGRAFGPEDARQGAQPVAIIGYELWRTRFGSNPQILTRSLQLGSVRRLIVGVAPEGFHFPPGAPTDVIVPNAVPATAPAQRKSGWIFSLARLKPGHGVDAANTELSALSDQFERQFPEYNRGSRYYAEPLREALVGETKRPLLLMLAAVTFVLLIACVNVGNLLLARGLAQQQEMAVRMALGAARGRLASQILTEGLVLAVAGGLVGIAVAWRAAPALAALVPQTPSIVGLDAVRINAWVLAFSVTTSVVAAVIFSGIACLRLTRGHERDALAATRRTTPGAGTRRTASVLVAGEIALAAVLLLGAGLTLRSFANLVAVDPGFRTTGVLTLQVGLPAGGYQDAAARRGFYDRAFEAIRGLPGVEAAGAAVVTPLTNNNWTVPLQRSERPVAPGERPPEVGWQAASGGYFSTMGIPLLAGRLFDARDTADTPPVVIISAQVARQFFAGEAAVGKRVRIGNGDAEIVGVVGDIRRAALTDDPRADMYFPFERDPDTATTIFVRASGDPLVALPAVRTALRHIDPNVLVYGTRTMDEIAARSAAVARLSMRLLGGFALVALLLAAVGIYGVMAYSVRQRTRELGTRIALGASRGDIIRLVMRQGAIVTASGLLVGILAGTLAARALSAALYNVPPADPLAVGASSVLLVVAAMAASYVPARRAARVDPALTLTVE